MSDRLIELRWDNFCVLYTHTSLPHSPNDGGKVFYEGHLERTLQEQDLEGFKVGARREDGIHRQMAREYKMMTLSPATKRNPDRLEAGCGSRRRTNSEATTLPLLNQVMMTLTLSPPSSMTPSAPN